ncbi:hypothetical protein IFU30_19285 [Plantibacter sp. CFBP 8798]|uniref:DUF7657 domain-containing protein n=1 Tax=Plantibacter sp. CFBP 8798 TaxID=2775268 RepID=UPI0017854721|nr:hypothetical protein [Plantibacter sp. CFBP 8798]MBD8468419.1 hypothetical protein [Plantibacter sp. CFBP 8798]
MRAPTVISTWQRRFADAMEPTTEGLPNRRTLMVPLVALLVVFIALVAAGITGSSSGILNQSVNSAADPNLLAGEPRNIRSDEWSVQTSWVISQVEQGLPVVNENFPGGMDSTVQNDLPSGDWSMAFRPHLLGFSVLPLDNAMAVRWWLPAFAMLAAVYLFAITLLPRRPLTSVLLSVGFFFAPFFQWWYLPITFWPVAWAFLLMAAVVWLLRTRRLLPRIMLPLLVGYTAVPVGMGVYVPFIIPATLVALAFCIGFVVTRSSSSISGIGSRLRSLWPIFVAGAGAAGVLGLWVATRWGTIQGFTSTVYPGERLQSTGVAGPKELLSLFSGPFTRWLGEAEGVPFGMNASEASTFILAGVFLALPILWLIVGQIRRKLPLDWASASMLILLVLIAAFMFVPGWDAIAHLLLLDRSPVSRIRLAVGMIAMVLTVLLIVRLDERRRAGERRLPLWVPVSTTGLAAATTAAIAWYVLRYDNILTAGTLWIGIVLLSVATVWWFVRGPVAVGAAAFALVSLLVGGNANPVYVGVYDLNGTTLVKTMKEIDAARPGAWVGAGNSGLLGVTLVQSGLTSFNGVQSFPPTKMWRMIDPNRASENAWNRLGNVSWGVGEGPPSPFNPTDDQIRLTFDSCNSFAQEHVSYVLSEFLIEQPCVQLMRTVHQGPSTFYIFEVVPGSD